MTKQRLYQKSYAPELLRIATGDLESAKVLRAATTGRRENVLFLAQQAIEKALKALLCARGIAVPLVHELAVVLDRFPQDAPVPRADEMVDLTQFATIRRYEEGKATWTEEEIEAVLQLASETLDWVRQQIPTPKR